MRYNEAMEQDTLSKIAAKEFNDRDIMWLMGMVRGYSLDLEEFKETINSTMKHEKGKKIFTFKINDLLEYTQGMEFDIDSIMDSLDLTIDDDGFYPVLFRGRPKHFEWINLCSIRCDSMPVNKDGFKTAQLVRGYVPIPPISLACMGDGTYKVKDGRCRFLAFKLNGLEKIPAYVHNNRKGKLMQAICKTSEDYSKTFKKLS